MTGGSIVTGASELAVCSERSALTDKYPAVLFPFTAEVRNR